VFESVERSTVLSTSAAACAYVLAGWSWVPRTPESVPWDGRELVLVGSGVGCDRCRELVLLGVGAWRSLGDGRCWLIVLALVGAGLGCVSRYTGGVGCARRRCRRGVRQSVCAVVMVRRWRGCDEMREPLAEKHVVDGVVSLCHCAVLLNPPLQLVRC